MDLGLYTIEGTWTGHVPEKEARGVISIKKQNLHSVNKNCNPSCEKGHFPSFPTTPF